MHDDSDNNNQGIALLIIFIPFVKGSILSVAVVVTIGGGVMIGRTAAQQNKCLADQNNYTKSCT